MSWLRSAVNRAVEVGGKSNLSKTVRSYADSVVHHAGNAVAEGAKILQDRIGSRNIQSFKLTVKRLEEVSVSCRGIERVQLLRRWLVALKESDRLSESFTENNEKEQFVHDDQSKDSPRRPTMIYYVDADLGTMNFRDVFLYSQAVEGMTLSMILEAPTEEEVSLLQELFGLCLAGGKEVHIEVLSSIQDLAASFANYEDEVLVKREELLQYAQVAVAGLKLNADISRIDAEASKIMEKLDKLVDLQPDNDDEDKSPAEKSTAATEALKETVGLIRHYSTLEALLLRKKSLSNGDSQQMHDEKVDKLKVLSESLLNSTKKAENRILEHRSQKEEALSYRVSKAGEVSQLEKDLAAEIRELEKQKGELEIELQRVTTSLNAARARLHNALEERQHFDEASNELLVHLKQKEEEISRSIASCRVEADVVNRWVKFLEDTWALHSAYAEQKEKQVNGDLERYGDYFLNLVIKLLTTYKEELEPAIIRFKEIEGDLHLRQGSETAAVIQDDDSKASRKKLEEQYLDFEAKFLTSLSVVDTMKRQFYTECKGIYRKDDGRIQNLFNALGKIKEEFESIERPVLDVETPKQRSQSLPSDYTFHGSPSSTPGHTPRTPRNRDRKSKSFSGTGETVIDTHLDYHLNGYSSEEIGDWVFDELETERK